jgi:hypothetical protein
MNTSQNGQQLTDTAPEKIKPEEIKTHPAIRQLLKKFFIHGYYQDNTIVVPELKKEILIYLNEMNIEYKLIPYEKGIKIEI